ncbi:MAG TPA: enoyl-CoA hydratase/isomerase family protein [Azospirillaceae bacterium]|nr:enoyl-CoA hydratase/isomerase family protein [Azospirillaceae bacterium]
MSILFQDALFEVRGGIGLITLNRPKALNALTLEMIRHIHPKLDQWAVDPGVKVVVIRGAGDRAFCAGGDIRAIYDAGLAWKRGEGDASAAHDFFRGEYRLNRRIKTFPKPYVALLDGIFMGGGVGLSVHGSHRVVTPKSLFAMPETGIGLFPDVGGTWFLPRCPGRTGTWMGLTGARLGPADLLWTGLGTHMAASESLDVIVDALAAADYGTDGHAAVDAVLEAHKAEVGEPTLPALQPAIDRCFAADSVEEILAALEAEGSEWALAQRDTLLKMSPTSLKVALAQIRQGEGLSFDDALRLEFRMTHAVIAGNDLFEGVRAVIVDKDRNPKWNPATLAAVGRAEVDRHFRHLGADELHFD